jgi:hypothetical protein
MSKDFFPPEVNLTFVILFLLRLLLLLTQKLEQAKQYIKPLLRR